MERVKSCEFFAFEEKAKLFLSAYVNDIKMERRKVNLSSQVGKAAREDSLILKIPHQQSIKCFWAAPTERRP